MVGNAVASELRLGNSLRERRAMKAAHPGHRPRPEMTSTVYPDQGSWLVLQLRLF